jgi:transposase
MELNDKEWKILEPLLPDLPTGQRGRPWRGHREVLDAILWVLRTGSPWRDLPKTYPPYQTCHRRFQQWTNDGMLEKVLETVANKLQKRCQLNLNECCIDGKFVPAKKGVPVLVRPSAVKARN